MSNRTQEMSAGPEWLREEAPLDREEGGVPAGAESCPPPLPPKKGREHWRTEGVWIGGSGPKQASVGVGGVWASLLPGKKEKIF